MMHLYLHRFAYGKDSTLGLFHINGTFNCFTLEDQKQHKKVYGKTHIPDGNYDITLRTEGGFHHRYSERFGEFHKGMLWLRDVPGFEYVLIHIGNFDSDTAGCILVGDTLINNIDRKGFIGESTKAYKRIYEKISNELLNDKKVIIHIDTFRV